MGDCGASTNIWCHLLIKRIKRQKSLHKMTSSDNRDINNSFIKGYLGQIYLFQNLMYRFLIIDTVEKERLFGVN